MLARILRIVTAWELLWALGTGWGLHAGAGASWPIAALVGLATPASVHAGLLIAGFRRALGPEARILGLTGFARLVWGEFVASFRAFQCEMPWTPTRPLPGETLCTAQPVPVLLVHGYLCNRQVWRPMASALAARGHAVAAVDLEPVFGSIDHYPPIIATAIDRLRARTGARSVALVGHSMGGLAARAYLRIHGGEAVAGMITIGSPHRGTRNAARGHGDNAGQMRPDSAWLVGLRAAEAQGPLARRTVILSRHDNVIVPQLDQTLPGAEVIAFDRMGHLAMLSDRRVHAAVLDVLARLLEPPPAITAPAAAPIDGRT